jgi:hypothetical protein
MKPCAALEGRKGADWAAVVKDRSTAFTAEVVGLVGPHLASLDPQLSVVLEGVVVSVSLVPTVPLAVRTGVSVVHRGPASVRALRQEVRGGIGWDARSQALVAFRAASGLADRGLIADTLFSLGSNRHSIGLCRLSSSMSHNTHRAQFSFGKFMCGEGRLELHHGMRAQAGVWRRTRLFWSTSAPARVSMAPCRQGETR